MATAILEITNCMDCPNHTVISDPDPHDSFCYDDEAVLCKKATDPNMHERPIGWIGQPYRPITVACRPYQKRKECDVPDWCPITKEN
jgi:hypothetical protein